MADSVESLAKVRTSTALPSSTNPGNQVGQVWRILGEPIRNAPGHLHLLLCPWEGGSWNVDVFFCPEVSPGTVSPLRGTMDLSVPWKSPELACLFPPACRTLLGVGRPLQSMGSQRRGCSRCIRLCSFTKEPTLITAHKSWPGPFTTVWLKTSNGTYLNAQSPFS